MLRIVDSSGWIEYFIDGPNADKFAEAIEDTPNLIVPSIILTEVYRWMLRQTTEANALSVLAVMQQARIVDLDALHAVAAAELSHRNKLPLADGIIYTTARKSGAVLLTQDADMEALEGVQYIAHPKRLSQ